MGDESTGIAVRCACGSSWTTKQWAELELVGIQDDGEGIMIEMRNCPCGSTRARNVDFQAALRLVNETAKRLRRALGRLRGIDRAVIGLSQEIADIDRGASNVDDTAVERERCKRIVRETLESIEPHESVGKPLWLRILSETLEARIAHD